MPAQAANAQAQQDLFPLSIAYAWKALLMVTACVPAWVFAIGAVAKFSDPTKPLVFIQGSLGVPYPWSLWLIIAIAVVEFVVAVWLAFDLGRSIWPGIVSMGLIAFFAGLLLAVSRMHPGTGLSCPCFGELQPPFGGRSVMGQFRLDAFLAALLFVHVVVALRLRRSSRRPRQEQQTSELPVATE